MLNARPTASPSKARAGGKNREPNRRSLLIIGGIFLFATAGWAQSCTIQFSVSYFDGQKFQTGLTKEQSTFWQKNSQEHYRNMCIDQQNPHYGVVWTLGLDAPPDLKANTSQVEGHPLGAGPWQGPTFNPLGSRSGMTAGGTWIAPHSVTVQARAYYDVFDLRENPPKLLRHGVGVMANPGYSTELGHLDTGAKVSGDVFSSTIADPTDALGNALNWMRKNLKKRK